jgi:hypothetical protein
MFDGAAVLAEMDANLARMGERWGAALFGGHSGYADCVQRQRYAVTLDPGCLDGARAPYDPGGAEAYDDGTWDAP